MSISSSSSSSNNSDYGLSAADIESLQNLAELYSKPKHRFDIDEQGHVGKPYAEGWSRSIIQGSIDNELLNLDGFVSSTQSLIQGSIDSEIPRIRLLLGRIKWARDMGLQVNSKMLENALDGMKRVQKKFFVFDQPEAAENMEKVIHIAEAVLKGIQVEPKVIEHKKEHKMKGEGVSCDLINEEATRSKLAKMVKCRQGEAEHISTDSRVSSIALSKTDGLNYYSVKIQSFLEFSQISNSAISSKQIALINGCMQGLELGLKIHQEFLEFISRYPKYDKVPVSRNPDIIPVNRLRPLLEESIRLLLEKGLSENPGVGILFPSGFVYKEKGDLYGHSAPLGIRGEGDQLYITQYNAGGGALGESQRELALNDSLFHLRAGQLPITTKGQTLITYGPFSMLETIRIMEKRHNLCNEIFANDQEATTAFNAVFDPKSQLPTSTPPRRFQVVGNCVTANVREWLVDTFQRHKAIDLFKELDLYGQERGADNPTYEAAEAGGRKAEDVLKLKVEETPISKVDDEPYLNITEG